MTKRSRFACLVAACIAAAGSSALAADPPKVEMTWLSIANWYFVIGGKRILMDGYVTRLPEKLFVASPLYANDRYTFTTGPAAVDMAAVTRVRDAMLGGDKLDLLLVGHSHWDHSWDTPAWSRLTGAPMVGGSSSCLQAAAQGVAAERCRSVGGGERIDLGEGVTMRVVRWNHSGDLSNPVQHFARELYRPPVPDPAGGGLRAGVGEDYPNGGGNRAFLFTIDRPGGKLSFFVNNSASAFDLDQPIVVDGIDHGSPIGNLAAAMKDAGLAKVDLWIGTGGDAVAKKVVPVLHPATYLPSHWDGLFNAFWPGIPFPFKDEPLKTYLAEQKIALLPQTQYFDKFVLGPGGVTAVPNAEVKRKLGFEEVKRFSRAMVEAVEKVSSTRVGDDCGEGFAPATDWQRSFAGLR